LELEPLLAVECSLRDAQDPSSSVIRWKRVHVVEPARIEEREHGPFDAEWRLDLQVQLSHMGVLAHAASRSGAFHRLKRARCMELAQLVDLAFSHPQTGLSNVGYIV
jgi:hypothetical protein